MATLDVERLRQSWKRLTPKADLFVSTFYDTLFERYPATLPLFDGVRFDEQKKKLLRALALIVRNAERPEFLAAYLQGLGGIHVAYGVRPEHYPPAGECLIAALSETFGKAWDGETEAAWRGAFEVISATMLGGARKMA